MTEEITSGSKFKSKSGCIFEVLNIARHGQICSIQMVLYTNLTPTRDYGVGEIWVIDKNIFKRRMERI